MLLLESGKRETPGINLAALPHWEGHVCPVAGVEDVPLLRLLWMAHFQNLFAFGYRWLLAGGLYSLCSSYGANGQTDDASLQI